MIIARGLTGERLCEVTLFIDKVCSHQNLMRGNFKSPQLTRHFCCDLVQDQSEQGLNVTAEDTECHTILGQIVMWYDHPEQREHFTAIGFTEMVLDRYLHQLAPAVVLEALQERDPMRLAQVLWDDLTQGSGRIQAEALVALASFKMAPKETLESIVTDFTKSDDAKKWKAAINVALSMDMFAPELLYNVVCALQGGNHEIITVAIMYLSEKVDRWYFPDASGLNDLISFHLWRVLREFPFDSSALAAQLSAHLLLTMHHAPEEIREIARFLDSSVIGQIVFLELISLLISTNDDAIFTTVWEILRDTSNEDTIREIVQDNEISEVGAQLASLILQTFPFIDHQMSELRPNARSD